jgi:hypothetical protein
MKTIIVLAALAAASFGQSRCITIKYPCDPIPTNIMFTVTDCQGNVLDMIPYRLGLPCLGQAQFCVPLSMGNVRIEAAVISGHTIVKTETFSVGCV